MGVTHMAFHDARTFLPPLHKATAGDHLKEQDLHYILYFVFSKDYSRLFWLKVSHLSSVGLGECMEP
jgi:hypothetical protein